MDRVGADFSSGFHDAPAVEITLRGGGGTDQDALVRCARVERSAIRLGVDGHRWNCHLPERAEDAHRDLTSICDQDLSKWGFPAPGEVGRALVMSESFPSSLPGGAAFLEEGAEPLLSLRRRAQARDRANRVLDRVVAAKRETLANQPLRGGDRARAVSGYRVDHAAHGAVQVFARDDLVDQSDRLRLGRLENFPVRK
jgi:hypothetical protein